MKRSRCLVVLAGLLATGCAAAPARATGSVTTRPTATRSAAQPAPQPAADADPIVATVQGEPIRRSAAVLLATPLLADIARLPDAHEREVRTALVISRTAERLGDWAIYAHEAARNHIEVSDADIDRLIESLAEERGTSSTQIYAAVVATGVTRDQYREFMRNELRRLRVVSLRGHQTSNPTEYEIATAYALRPAPRPPLDEVRADIERELQVARAPCVERGLLTALRAQYQVRLLVPPPPAESVAETPVQPWIVAADHVYFAGNAAVPSSELRPALGTDPTIQLSEGALPEAVLTRISAIYYDRGYLNAAVTNPRESLPECAHVVDHSIVAIHEGARYRVGTVTIHELGNDSREVPMLGGRAFQSRLRLHPGAWFSRAAVGADVAAILLLYRDAGFAAVDVTPDLTPHLPDLIDYAIVVRRGPSVRVSQIVINGLRRVPESTVRAAVTLAVDRPYSESRYQESERRVRALGVFERVAMSTAAVEGHPEQIVVTLDVVEPR